MPSAKALLEIGVLDLDGDDPVVIHAMLLSPEFRQLLELSGWRVHHDSQGRGRVVHPTVVGEHGPEIRAQRARRC